MIEIKIDTSKLDKILEENKEFKKKFDKIVKNMAVKIFRESYNKYFPRTFLFYHCPNIMKNISHLKTADKSYSGER